MLNIAKAYMFRLPLFHGSRILSCANVRYNHVVIFSHFVYDYYRDIIIICLPGDTPITMATIIWFINLRTHHIAQAKLLTYHTTLLTYTILHRIALGY